MAANDTVGSLCGAFGSRLMAAVKGKERRLLSDNILKRIDRVRQGKEIVASEQLKVSVQPLNQDSWLSCDAKNACLFGRHVGILDRVKRGGEKSSLSTCQWEQNSAFSCNGQSACSHTSSQPHPLIKRIFKTLKGNFEHHRAQRRQ